MPENYGIKVSPPGTSVDLVTDKNALFDTKYSSLKMFKWGDAQFTTDGSKAGSVVINHNLNYTPIALVFKKFTAQYTFLSATTYSNAFRQVGSANSYDSPALGFKFDTDDTTLTISTDSSDLPAASTTYYFRYIIFVDLSRSFSGISNLELTGNYGFKVAKNGYDVSAEEHNMAFSSKYKSLQYYDGHILSSSLTLPAMFASRADTYVEEATYVDFNHNLGFPPFFLVYSDIGTAYLYEMPYLNVSVSGVSYDGLYEVSSWCDSTRVRVLFKRISQVVGSGTYGENYSAATINIKVIIFAENLMGDTN